MKRKQERNGKATVQMSEKPNLILIFMGLLNLDST